MTNLSSEQIKEIIEDMNKIRYFTVQDKIAFESARMKKYNIPSIKKKTVLQNYFCEYNFHLSLSLKIYEILNIKHDIFCVNPYACWVIHTFIDNNLDLLKKQLEKISKEQQEHLQASENQNAEIIKNEDVLNNKIMLVFFKKYFNKWFNNFKKFSELDVPLNICTCNCVEVLIAGNNLKSNFVKFEGNMGVFISGIPVFTGNKVIKNALRQLPIFNLMNVDFFSRSYENSALKNFSEIIRNKYFNEIMEIKGNGLPWHMKNSLFNLLYKLNFRKWGNLSTDDYVKGNVKFDDERLVGLQTTVNYNLVKKNISNYVLLLNTLYILTDGKKEYLDNLAKLIAKIILGKKSCERFGLKINNSSVVYTNNKIFMEEFLKSLFLVGATSQTSFDYLRNINQKGLTNYSLKALSDPSMIGSFIRDKLEGCFLNITSDTNDCYNEKFLINLIQGKEVQGKNYFLGPQSLKSESYYIFITNTNFENKDICELSDKIHLSENIPDNCFFWDISNRVHLTDSEKEFMLVNFAEYGLDLLLNEVEQRTEVENNKNRKIEIADPIKFFIENCCVVKNKTNIIDKPDKYNATACKTLEAGYRKFFEIIYGYEPPEKWGSDLCAKYGFKVKDRTKSAAIIKRDKQAGYSEKEVLTINGGNHCMGLVIKSKEDIIHIAQKYKESKEDNNTNLTKEEFIQIIANLGNFTYFKIKPSNFKEQPNFSRTFTLD